jgi:hypothetical protein
MGKLRRPTSILKVLNEGCCHVKHPEGLIGTRQLGVKSMAAPWFARQLGNEVSNVKIADLDVLGLLGFAAACALGSPAGLP